MAIRSKNGRTWTEPTIEESIQLIKQEFANLKPEERELVLMALREQVDPAITQPGGPVPILDLLHDSEYIRPLVDIETFVKDPYYLGATSSGLYPKLLKDVEEIFRGGYQEVIIGGAIGVGKCAEKNTEIYDTFNGTRRRVSEVGYFTVASMIEGGKIGSRFSKAFYSGVKHCLKITTSGGQSVTLSDDHPVFLQDGWRCASDLKVGDFIAAPRRMPEPRKCLDVSDEEVKLVAYLLADSSPATRSTYFSNLNSRTVEELRRCVEAIGDGKQNLNVLRRKYNLTVPSRDKRVPAEFYGLSNRQIALFVNRFWACDGCLNQKNGIEITLTSSGLVDDLRFMLLRLGIYSVKNHELSTFIHNGKSKTVDTWRLHISGMSNVRRFCEVVGPILGKERYYDELVSYCKNTINHTNVDTELNHKGKYGWLADAELVWEKVVSIEDAGNCEVYDLSVDESHNFIGNNIILHNTFTASIIICRLLYELSCLRDIHASVGLAPGSDISIVGISVNETLAQRVVFENITTKIAASPYFQENFPFQETKKELRFPNNVLVAALSTTDTSALGRNVIAALMDEGNFYEGIQRGKASLMKYGERDKARVLYDQMVRRMKSRFLKGGKMPGKMVIVSSKRTKDDFTAKRIAESLNDPTVYVMDYRLWELVPDRFSPERFHVLVGNETLPSRILKPEEVDTVREKIKEAEDDSLVILEVPADFRADFENGLEEAIRDIGGVSTVSVSPFIQQRDKIELCIDPTRQHPFSVEEWDQSLPGTFIWEKICKRGLVRDGAEVFESWIPLYYPGHARHIHIDFSLNTDYTGITCGCVVGKVPVQRRNKETNEVYTEMSPQFWIDFMLRIKPPTGGEIDFGQIRGLVYQLQSHGFYISLITSDQAHSAANMQKFHEKGFTVERVSVDRTIDAYDTLKTALYERRVLMYRYEPVLEELRKLQKDNVRQKVDHPRGGRKDVADSLAGVVFTLTNNAHHPPTPPVRGISQYSDPQHEKDRQVVDNKDEWYPPLIIG